MIVRVSVETPARGLPSRTSVPPGGAGDLGGSEAGGVRWDRRGHEGPMLTSRPMSDPGPSRQRFVDAAFGRPVDLPPVWLMRQAGRYLPEYREVRKSLAFLDLCADVPSAVEVSMQPFRRFGMDGVILFSDILIPLPPMGIEVKLDEGGPKLPTPIRTDAQVERAPRLRPDRRDRRSSRRSSATLKKEVAGRAAVIGFCGAPWTLATYAIEGGGSKSFTAHEGDDVARAEAPRGSPRASSPTPSATTSRRRSRRGPTSSRSSTRWAGELSRADYDRFAAPRDRAAPRRASRSAARSRSSTSPRARRT